jgi:hypothetical protein
MVSIMKSLCDFIMTGSLIAAGRFFHIRKNYIGTAGPCADDHEAISSDDIGSEVMV